jgi:Ca-activated chloride channel family protein
VLSTLSFAAPGRLALLVAVVALAVATVAVRYRARRDRAALASPALQSSLLPAGPGWRRGAAAALLMTALTLATVGFARPQVLADSARERSIVLVALDTSTSMLADDVKPSRFTAAVEAAQDFVRGLPEHVDVGLVAYNANVRLVSAPTSDHAQVVRDLEDLHLSGGTALGEAVLTGLTSLPPDFRSGPTGGAPAARIVVLSDGGSTTGRPVADAAAQAKAFGVPVSTIAYGTDAGVVVQGGRTYPVPVDPAVLTQLAQATGGTAYRASDGAQLQQVYADIGSRVTQETARRELTTPVTGAAAGVLGLAGLSSLLWTRRLV